MSWYPSKVTSTLDRKEAEPPEESLRTEAGGTEGEFWYIDMEYEYCDSNIDPAESRLASDYISSSNDSSTEVFLQEGTQEYSANTMYNSVFFDTVSLTLHKLE